MKKILFSMFLVAGSLALTMNVNAQNKTQKECCKTEKACCKEKKACCTESKECHNLDMKKMKAEKACCSNQKAVTTNQKATCKHKKNHRNHKMASPDVRAQRQLTFLKKNVEINEKEEMQIMTLFSSYEKERDAMHKKMDVDKMDVDKMTRQQRRAFHKKHRDLNTERRNELHKKLTVILGKERGEKVIKACELRQKKNTEKRQLRENRINVQTPEIQEENQEELPIMDDF